MDLGVRPYGHLRCDVGQKLQEHFLGFGENAQRLLSGRAMNPVACLLEHPPLELLVGIAEAAELSQGQKTPFDVLDPALHPALFLRIPRRAGADQEAVGLRKVPVRALYIRVIITCTGNRALRVVDNHFTGNPIEKLKSMAVRAKPRSDCLVQDQFGILVAAVAKCHDKNPGLEHFAGKHIRNGRTRSEVHLCSLAGLKIEHTACLYVALIKFLQETPHRGVAAGKPVAVKRPVNRRSANTLLPPLLDLTFKRFNQRGLSRSLRTTLKQFGQDLILRERNGRQKAVPLRNGPYLGTLDPAHQPALGNGTVALPHAHPKNNLAVMMHLEPPVCHGSPSRKIFSQKSTL